MSVSQPQRDRIVEKLEVGKNALEEAANLLKSAGESGMRDEVLLLHHMAGAEIEGVRKLAP